MMIFYSLLCPYTLHPKPNSYHICHGLTCDVVAINHAAGILTLRSKLTSSLLHSFRFRTAKGCPIPKKVTSKRFSFAYYH